jgi:hypothetical protein
MLSHKYGRVTMKEVAGKEGGRLSGVTPAEGKQQSPGG